MMLELTSRERTQIRPSCFSCQRKDQFHYPPLTPSSVSIPITSYLGVLLYFCLALHITG